MYCTCGCGKELGIETFHYAKKEGAFGSEACLDEYYKSKQIDMIAEIEDEE